MTLDEAIRHAEEVAEEKEKDGKLLCQSESASMGCLTCAEEHRQLALWLRDYKRLKEQKEITWVTGADGAKVAFWDVPIPKVLKICKILQEPTITSTENNAEMIYPQVEGITPTVINEDIKMDDLIQRQTVLNLCDMRDKYKIPYEYDDGSKHIKGYDEGRIINVTKLKMLPSVKPQTGHWIDLDEKSAVCSCCYRNNTLFGDYCKWCGAKMVEPQESEEV